MDSRNETVDALRGLAALSVCFFHFTNGTHFRATSYLAPIGAYGWLGVEVFFVISGFIVPYAMLRAGYTLSAWPTFMVKRLIRLEPPYLVSIAIVMLLGIASTMAPGFQGPPIDWTPAQIAGHLGYLNTFLGLPWLNPVYWSLAIEFQFYVLIGLVMPALRRGAARRATHGDCEHDPAADGTAAGERCNDRSTHCRSLLPACSPFCSRRSWFAPRHTGPRSRDLELP